MNSQKVYTIIGIGLGPFNLGLAALLQPVKEVQALFFDENDGFDWHPGLLLSSTTLQDPFMGTDLVTMADPTSKYSFLNFLKQTGRLYKFFIRHDFYMLRSEYNVYCKWVAEQLSSCRFAHKVTKVAYNDELYEVTVWNNRKNQEETYYTQKLVLGTGTKPWMPFFADTENMPGIFHSSQYLYNKEDVLRKGELTIVGSGQSAAEVFYDLLPEVKAGFRLHWFTRSDRFFPMEHSKLTLELSSPDYVDYFYHLSAARRKKILTTQHTLSKGINYDLINNIYDALYEMTVKQEKQEKPNVLLNTNCELLDITTDTNNYTLHFKHLLQDKEFACESKAILLATGYRYNTPAFLQGIKQRICYTGDGLLDVHRNYTIDVNHNEVFVQNAETHTHGFTAPDLSLGAHRNSWIINAITGKEIYTIDERIAFQQFGVQDANESISAFSQPILHR